MEWLHKHPLFPWIGGGAVLILGGLIVVSSRIAYTPPEYATTWSSINRTYTTPISGYSNRATNNDTRITPFRYDPPIPNLSSQKSPEQTEVSETTEDVYEQFLASIRPSTYPVTASNDFSFLDDVYSLIPQGIRAVQEPKKLSDEAHTFYEFGNEIGSYIETYESSYGVRAVPILKDFYANRSSQEKQEAVRTLGRSIERVGEEIAAMESIPSGLKEMSALIAERYKDTGKKLALFPDAKDDDELLQLINEYNESVNALTTAVSTLAIFFASAEISFASYEPGSVFMFSPAATF